MGYPVHSRWSSSLPPFVFLALTANLLGVRPVALPDVLALSPLSLVKGIPFFQHRLGKHRLSFGA